MNGTEIVHPQWCDREKCRVDQSGAAYAMHQSQPVAGCLGLDKEGRLVELSLYRFPAGQPMLLLEFPDGAEDGVELTTDQVERFVASMTKLLAEARS